MSSYNNTSDDDETGVQVQAVDVDEIVRRRRMRSIFDAKEDCQEARTKAHNNKAVGDLEVARIVFRGALETYVREVEPLFSQTEQGRRYWTDYDFGELVVSPTVETEQSKRRGGGTRRTLAKTGSEIAGEVPSERFALTGLKSLFELPSPITFEARCRVKSSGFSGGYSSDSITVKRHLPVGKLDEMYAVTNGYLGEIGLDIEVSRDDDEWEI